ASMRAAAARTDTLGLITPGSLVMRSFTCISSLAHQIPSLTGEVGVWIALHPTQRRDGPANSVQCGSVSPPMA
ncbi:MAG: hypothetical protein WD533_00550, partial [Dehalococcoidia bacterium]